MSVRPRRIGHVAVISRDLDRLIAFYEDVLGFQVSDRIPYPEDSPFLEGVWMRCNTEHHVLSAFALRVVPPAPADPRGLDVPGFHHVAYEMASFADLRRVAQMAREGDLPVYAMRDGGPGAQLRIYLWDPDDRLVELYWGLDQIGWDGRVRPLAPITAVDLETIDIDAWLAGKGPEFVPGAPAALDEPV